MSSYDALSARAYEIRHRILELISSIDPNKLGELIYRLKFTVNSL